MNKPPLSCISFVLSTHFPAPLSLQEPTSSPTPDLFSRERAAGDAQAIVKSSLAPRNGTEASLASAARFTTVDFQKIKNLLRSSGSDTREDWSSCSNEASVGVVTVFHSEPRSGRACNFQCNRPPVRHLLDNYHAPSVSGLATRQQKTRISVWLSHSSIYEKLCLRVHRI